MSKPRVKAGPVSAPSVTASIAAAGAAEDLKERIEGNGIAKGEKATSPPQPPPEGAPTRAERRRKASERPKPSDIPAQGRTGRKAQQELPGMPKLDGVGKAARKFLDALDALETAKETRQTSMSNVINALKAAKRKEINVDGYTITYIHKEAVDRIKVKKPSTK